MGAVVRSIPHLYEIITGALIIFQVFGWLNGFARAAPTVPKKEYHTNAAHITPKPNIQ